MKRQSFRFSRLFFWCASLIGLSLMQLYAQAERDFLLNGKEDLEKKYYRSARYFFEEALKINPNNVEAQFYQAVSQIHLHQAEKGLSLLAQISPAAAPQGEVGYYYWLAEAHFLNEDFAAAQNSLLSFKKSREKDSKQKAYDALATHLEAQLGEAQKAYTQPYAIFIENLGTEINSEFDEFGILLDKTQRDLIFTTNRESQNHRQAAHLYDKDRFTTHYSTQNSDGSWKKNQPFYVSDEAHSSQTDEVIVLQILERSFTGSDKKLLISKNGQLHLIEQKQGIWQPSQLFSPTLDADKGVQKYAVLSKKQDFIIFASDYRSKENFELFVAYYDKNLKDWQKPEPLDSLNSTYHEVSPFLADDQTLYFSSKGHNAMGGYDVFKSTFEPKTKKWRSPTRLPYPINSVADDFYFNLEKEVAYLVSNRKGSIGGEDIFRFFLFDSLTLKGKVQNRDSQEPLAGAKILIFNSEEAATSEKAIEKHWLAQSDAQGEYQIRLPLLPQVKISVILNEKTLYEQSLRLNPSILARRSEKIYIQNFHLQVQKEIKMDDFLTSGSLKKYILKNIYFEIGSANLEPRSFPELLRLADFMRQNPDLSIEIGGHTDNVGSPKSNLVLSQARAEAVRVFLIEKGKIEAYRLQAQGYGQTQPIASNDDELEGRELNRRIEVKILPEE
ncbi:OmpA family protein [Hugenholtzia roseola]|uniref:OmpA family protein n=1 Tax=Hugenholtzia roseola TaxID=1002 RepID=UPI00041422F4|nr:OmpA family protein [Hugenholtzia roseola]